MPDVTIRIRATKDGWEAFDEAGNALKDIGRAGEQGSGGLDSLAKGAADAVQGIQFMANAIGQSGGLIDSVNQIGVASLRAKEGLNAMSGGQSVQYLQAMSTATHGLVDDMSLAKDATLALSTGVIHSSDAMAQLTKDGATLGMVFQGDAQSGIESLTHTLEQVGATRPLKTLGLDAQVVKTEFEQLSKTMSREDAWGLAVMDEADRKALKLAGTLDSTGTAIERAKVNWDNFKKSAGENVALGLQGIADIGGAVTGGTTSDSEALRARQQLIKQLFPGSNLAKDIDQGQAKLDYQQQVWDLDRMDFGGTGGYTGSKRGYSLPGMRDVYTPGLGVGSTFNELSNRAGMASVMADPAQKAAYGARMEQQAELERGKALVDNLQSKIFDPLQSVFTKGTTMAQGVMTDYAEVIKAQAARSRSIDAAFGVSGSGLGSETGAGLTQLAGSKPGGKQALDDFQIATGQATKESIRYRDMVGEVDSAMAKGNITMAQGAKILAEWTNNAKNGATSMADLTKESGELTEQMRINQELNKAPAFKGAARNRPKGPYKDSVDSDPVGGTVAKADLYAGVTDTVEHGGGRRGATDLSDVVLPDRAKLATAYDPFIDAGGKAIRVAADVGSNANTAANVAIAANLRMAASYGVATGAALALAAAQSLVH